MGSPGGFMIHPERTTEVPRVVIRGRRGWTGSGGHLVVDFDTEWKVVGRFWKADPPPSDPLRDPPTYDLSPY